MEAQPSPAYRGLHIVINPSGTPAGGLTDAFMVLEPSENPMFTVTLHEHPRGQVKTYPTQAEARDAALQLARTWIDGHMGKQAS